MAIVGNKYDKYGEEEVNEKEAEEFANKIGAHFQLTSALQNFQIEDLFYELGKRFLDKNYSKKEKEELKNNYKLSKDKVIKKNKKKCCLF